jgi:VWFA-related protein
MLAMFRSRFWVPGSNGSLRFGLLLISLFCSGTSGAQQTSPPAGAPAVAGDSEIAATESVATFKVSVNLVTVKVVVRDERGNAVGNLQHDDFLVFDDHKSQVIKKFSAEHSTRGNDGKRKKQGVEAAAPENSRESLPERYVAYVFDDYHLSFGDLARARRAAEKHFSSPAESGARTAIFTTSNRVTVDFTDNTSDLIRALARISSAPIAAQSDCPFLNYYLASLILDQNDKDAAYAVALDAVQRGCLTNPDVPDVRAAAAQVLEAGRVQAGASLAMLRDVVRRVSTKPGERTVVFISPGFITPAHQHEFMDLLESALRSKVVVNTLDTRGVIADPSYGADIGGEGSRIARGAATRTLGSFRLEASRSDSDVLAGLAAGTGGTWFQNNNDIGLGLARLAGPAGDSYLLAFSPQNLKQDGRFHTLQIKLKQPGKLTVYARRGYYASSPNTDPEQNAKQEIEDAVFSQEELQEVPLQLMTQFFKTAEDASRIAVIARIDLSPLPFRRENDRNRDTLTVVFGLFDRNGGLRSAVEKTVEMRMRDRTLQKRASLDLKSSFDAPPGTYVVRVVLRDRIGRLMSARNAVVEIP